MCSRTKQHCEPICRETHLPSMRFSKKPMGGGRNLASEGAGQCGGENASVYRGTCTFPRGKQHGLIEAPFPKTPPRKTPTLRGIVRSPVIINWLILKHGFLSKLSVHHVCADVGYRPKAPLKLIIPGGVVLMASTMVCACVRIYVLFPLCMSICLSLCLYVCMFAAFWQAIASCCGCRRRPGSKQHQLYMSCSRIPPINTFRERASVGPNRYTSTTCQTSCRRIDSGRPAAGLIENCARAAFCWDLPGAGRRNSVKSSGESQRCRTRLATIGQIRAACGQQRSSSVRRSGIYSRTRPAGGSWEGSKLRPAYYVAETHLASHVICSRPMQ